MPEMTAGRELDALILERVIGFRWDENRCRVCGWPLDRARGGVGCRPDDCSMRPKPINRADEPPHYSTSIAEAWLVVEKLMADGWTVTLAPRQFEKYPDDRCVFHGCRFVGSPQKLQSFSAHAETAPLAICRAALKAINQEAAA